jgi:hypothetical protein
MQENVARQGRCLHDTVDCAIETSSVTKFFGSFRSAMVCLALFFTVHPGPACLGAVPMPTAEFETPYQVQLSPDGTILALRAVLRGD